MENFFARTWKVLALRGACGILFGVLALMWPQLTLLTLVLLFAAYALVGGITAIAGAVRHRRQDDDWWVMLLLGIVSTGAGVLAIANPGVTALVLVLIIGANALVTGTLDIVSAIRLRRTVAGEWMLVLSGLASMAFGAIVFLAPGAGALATAWLISMYAFVTGVLLLAAALRARAVVMGRQPAHGERRSMMGDRRAAPAS